MTDCGILDRVRASALETVQRWEAAGGHWQMLSRSSSGLVVALLRCDGGEEAHRLVSADPALDAYIGDREIDQCGGVKSSGGCVVAEALARSAIEFAGDGVQVTPSQPAHALSLGQVLAQ